MVQRLKGILYTAPAVTVLCCAVACSSAPPKTPGQQQADDQLEQRVESALNSDPTLYAGKITVQADNGVVHLGGYVWDTDDLYEAQHVAGTVHGVGKVVNEMELEVDTKPSAIGW